MVASKNAVEAPAHDTTAPAAAGPAAKAALRASSSRLLATPSSARGTSAGTSAGAATLKPTVPEAPTKPNTASSARLNCPLAVAASSPASDSARSASAATISRRRELRSASRPSGIDSSRKGRLCAVLSRPISPGPAFNASTATMGTAARLTCSAACAARLAPARVLKDWGRVAVIGWGGWRGPVGQHHDVRAWTGCGLVVFGPVALMSSKGGPRAGRWRRRCRPRVAAVHAGRCQPVSVPVARWAVACGTVPASAPCQHRAMPLRHRLPGRRPPTAVPCARR